MAGPRPSRVSSAKIIQELRRAARKGDRAALTLALADMRTLALSPRYWEKYLALLGNPMARLVDLLVIKQGERIAHQKGWKQPGRRRSAATSAGPPPAGAPSRRGPRAQGLRSRGSAARRPAAEQQSLFEL